jgi:hypothetical protein
MRQANRDLNHEPKAGRDGIVRCRFCNTVLIRKVATIPCSVPCPSLDKSIGLAPMVTTPVNAFLIDLLAGVKVHRDKEEIWESAKFRGKYTSSLLC